MLQDAHSDEDLMSSYQEGSEESFKALYYRHAGKILGYLKSRTQSEQDAVDLFQEVFVKVHKSKHLYNKSLPVLPWIFSVTHSVLIDGHRKTERKKEVLDLDLDQFAAESEAPSASSTNVLPLLQALPANQKSALHLRYVEEKTFEDIAATLKTSPLNVRQLISRGIKNIKRNLKEGDSP